MEDRLRVLLEGREHGEGRDRGALGQCREHCPPETWKPLGPGGAAMRPLKASCGVTLLAGMVREAGLALPRGGPGQRGGWALPGDLDPDLAVTLVHLGTSRPFQDPRATTENPSGGVQRLRLLELRTGLPPCLPLG